MGLTRIMRDMDLRTRRDLPFDHWESVIVQIRHESRVKNLH
jgi:hypothetical protein